MDKQNDVFKAKKLTLSRKLIQFYSALLYNAYLKGFLNGDIFTGISKAVCVPGLNCYSCPGAIGSCPLGSLQNALANTGHRAPFYVLGILMIYGLLLGRTVCGWLCPAGLIQELLYKLPTPKLKKGRLTRLLTWFKYVILAVFVIGMPLYLGFAGESSPTFCKYICPAGTMEGAIVSLFHPDNFGWLDMLNSLFAGKFVILVVIIVACVFVYRGFCRFLCPLGAIYSLFSKLSLSGIKVNREKCNSCGRCTTECRMDVRFAGDRECVHCGKCIPVCGTKAITLNCGKIVLAGNDFAGAGSAAQKTIQKKRRGAALFALLLLTGIILYVNFFPVNKMQAVSMTTESADSSLDFSVPLYASDQSRFSLKEHRGKVVVINFWATWCAPCAKELPDFVRLQTQYPKDVTVIAIHSKLVTEDLDAYLRENSLPLQFGLDENGSVMEMFGDSTQLPMTVIIDQNGNIIYNNVGSVTFELLKSIIEPLL